MPLVDVTLTVDPKGIIVSPSIPSADINILGAPGIRGPQGATGPQGPIGLTGANVYISETPPNNPVNGSLWLKSDTGVRYLWYVDADGGQWIADSGPIGPAGPNSIGGVGFSITNLTTDDTIIYNGTAWANTPKATLTDGGNF